VNGLPAWMASLAIAAAAITWVLKTLKTINPTSVGPRLNGELSQVRAHVTDIRAIVDRMERTLPTREDLTAQAAKNLDRTSAHLEAVLTIVRNMERLIEELEAEQHPKRRGR
jgi:hypothetical protein